MPLFLELDEDEASLIVTTLHSYYYDLHPDSSDAPKAEKLVNKIHALFMGGRH